MEILAFQTDIEWENSTANFDRIRERVEAEVIEPGSLLVFPELSTVGFTMNASVSAEFPDGPSTRFFTELARRHQSFVIAGLARRTAADSPAANEAVCFSPKGEEVAAYRKRHPFPLAGEPEVYPAGQAIEVFSCGAWKVSPFICYDLRFPEAFREASGEGAELLVVIANWPEARVEHWRTLLRARAIENQAYVVGVNRAGSDPNFDYPGASAVIDPMGEAIAEAGSEPEVIRARLDRANFESWRREFPALREWQERYRSRSGNE